MVMRTQSNVGKFPIVGAIALGGSKGYGSLCIFLKATETESIQKR